MFLGKLKTMLKTHFPFVKKKMSKLLKLMIRHPLSFPKTMYYNLRYLYLWPSRIFKFPLVTSWRSVVKCSRKASISIDKRLVLGLFTTRIGEVGQISYDRTIVQLAPHRKLIIDGTVKLGLRTRVIRDHRPN